MLPSSPDPGFSRLDGSTMRLVIGTNYSMNRMGHEVHTAMVLARVDPGRAP
jgi:hypothetical protein